MVWLGLVLLFGYSDQPPAPAQSDNGFATNLHCGATKTALSAT
jgi:hypothetical protein